MLTTFHEVSIAASLAFIATRATDDIESYAVNGSGFMFFCNEAAPGAEEAGDYVSATWSLGIWDGQFPALTLDGVHLFEIAEAINELAE